MNNQAFLTAIYSTEPPCNGCLYFNDCATKKLACRAFFYYTVSKSDRPIKRFEDDIPTREGYDYVFQTTDSEQVGRLKRGGRPKKKTFTDLVMAQLDKDEDET